MLKIEFSGCFLIESNEQILRLVRLLLRIRKELKTIYN
jgi:hypothetical protein